MLKCGRKYLHLAPRLQRQSHRLANGHQQILTQRNQKVCILCQSFRAVIQGVFEGKLHMLKSCSCICILQVCIPVMISIALGRTQNRSYCRDLFLTSSLFHVLNSVYCRPLILFLTCLLLLSRSGACLCPNDREIMRSEGWIVFMLLHLVYGWVMHNHQTNQGFFGFLL